MPTSVGPNTYGEENLVFGYDLGDARNSYKGEPVTNSHNYDKSVMTQTGFDGWGCYDGNNSSPSYHSWDVAQSKTLVNIPGPDNKDVNAMLYHNFTGGSHGPTDWGTGVLAALVTAGNKITLQGWVKAADVASIGKTVTPYIYVYVNGGGAQAAATNFTLTADWQLVSTTMTVGADGYNSNGYVYFFTGGGSNIKMYLTKTAVLSGKDHAVQWLPGGTTRSVTQGLLDITGNSTIDLTNVSFDSNAQITFDGTNDRISNFNHSISSIEYCTVSMWLKDSVSTVAHRGPFWISDASSRMLFLDIRSDYNHFQINTETKANNRKASSNQSSLVNGQWHNVVIVRNGSSVAGYIDGEPISLTQNDGYGGWNISTNDLSIGAFIDNGSIYSYWAGSIDKFEIYNRVLTASEIKSNYNAIKGRFNI